MKNWIIRSLSTAILMIFSTSAFAQQNIDCSRVSNEVLAQEFLHLIESGADEGISNNTCETAKAVKHIKIAEVTVDEVLPREILEQNDLVMISAPVREIVDSEGPTNIYKVDYIIEKQNGQKLKGTFTFSRIYEESYHPILGCGVLQNEPSVSFIRKDCR